MSAASRLIGQGKQMVVWAEQQDKDPSKWPVAAGIRVYMIDCELCGSRMAPSAIAFHTRRCMRVVRQFR